ncbi:Hypothetical predicted protein, partial [Pelobates cultripes]
ERPPGATISSQAETIKEVRIQQLSPQDLPEVSCKGTTSQDRDPLQNRSTAMKQEPSITRTPEATTVQLSRSTSSTTKIRKPSPADWSRYRISCKQKNQA